MSTRPKPTGREVLLGDDELIVSKTDPKGRLVYFNSVFERMSGYDRAEMLGQPHSMIRHADMPRAVFKLLWDAIESGREIFAYVMNMAKNGDHYWVIAHVTPSFAGGQIVGFHSNRRKPDRAAVEAITAIYRDLRAAETRPDDRKQGLEQGTAALNSLLTSKGVSYDEFVLSL
jgi:PAS domain S-box-containing protein